MHWREGKIGYLMNLFDYDDAPVYFHNISKIRQWPNILYGLTKPQHRPDESMTFKQCQADS
jgi:hypothetical protein